MKKENRVIGERGDSVDGEAGKNYVGRLEWRVGGNRWSTRVKGAAPTKMVARRQPRYHG
jgi:hypothetical protein